MHNQRLKALRMLMLLLVMGLIMMMLVLLVLPLLLPYIENEDLSLVIILMLLFTVVSANILARQPIDSSTKSKSFTHGPSASRLS
jgi:tellurite resistance protein TehA-like permease